MINLRTPNLIRELYSNNMIEHNLFTLCFGLNSGYFSVGKINNTLHAKNSSIIYLNHNPNDFFYTVNLLKILIDGIDIKMSNDTSVIIDSGTTLSLFPESAYKNIIKVFDNFSEKEQFPAKKTLKGEDYCFGLKPGYSKKNLYNSLPKFSFVFEKDNLIVGWSPKNYLYENDLSENILNYCIGISMIQ